VHDGDAYLGRGRLGSGACVVASRIGGLLYRTLSVDRTKVTEEGAAVGWTQVGIAGLMHNDLTPYDNGFYALERLALVYLVTGEYDETDEFSFTWDDPDAAIPWPTHDPILSDRGNQNHLYRRVAAPAQRS
jgi:hypothetical protein